MRELFALVCFVVVVKATPEELDANVRQQIDSAPFLLTDSMNAFNSKLFKSLSGSENGNIIYSPFSLHMLLSQAYAGAPTGSATSQELANLLSFKSENNADYLYNYLKVIQSLIQLSEQQGTVVDIANKIFAADDLNIKQAFKKALSTFYNSGIDKVDFKQPQETVDTINKFVSEKTRNLIDKILNANDLDGLSRLVMVNAVYFKGHWKFPFKSEETETKSFHVDSNREVEFSAMAQTKKLTLIRVDELEADVIELPYENEQLSMIVVVPTEESDVRKVEQKLEKFDIGKISERLDQNINSEVELVFPKFETDFSWDGLEDVLKSLGVETLFDENKANLTDIADEPLHVSKVVHKAVIKVNEEGSEAAAVSAAVIATRNEFAVKKAKLVVDRPFIFYIYDVVNRLPLFVGRIVDPNGKLKLE